MTSFGLEKVLDVSRPLNMFNLTFDVSGMRGIALHMFMGAMTDRGFSYDQ